MAVIKLTNAGNKEPLLINTAFFVKAESVADYTSIMLKIGDEVMLEIPVKETPEEILRLMRGKKIVSMRGVHNWGTRRQAL